MGTDGNDAYSPYYFDYDKGRGAMNTPHLLKKLRKKKYLVELDRKEILFRPGDAIDVCYLIDEGAIIGYEFSSGNRRIFDWYSKNDLIFCEYAVYDRPSCYFYEALENTKMYSIRLSYVKSLIQTDPKFAQSIIAQSTRNFMMAQDFLRKTITHSARWRVCDFLIVFSHYASEKTNGSIVLSKRISHKLMADMLFMNRITAMREIHALEDLGLCRMNNGHFEIPDMNMLIAYRDSNV